MAKAVSFSLVLLLLSFHGHTQSIINGKVTDLNRKGIDGVNVSQKGSYNGTSTDKDGSFQFQITDTGRIVLLFTASGYSPEERVVTLTGLSQVIDLVLREEITELNAVVVTAGTFEAGDKKRMTVLKSIDMVTVAGQQADIMSALRTLPGAQQVGDQDGLFVRGGSGAETRVFIDGMMVTNPFFSSVPNIAQRSRFSPLLFKGTAFSSGGYSAQYGQGLSSALILESIDLPSRSEINAIVSSAQVSVLTQKLMKEKKASVGLNFNYTNLNPYYNLVRQRYHFTKAPEVANIEFNYRKKTSAGMLKFYGYVSTNIVGLERPGLDHDEATESIRIKNYNAFTTFTYTGSLVRNWQFYGGISFSYNRDNTQLQTAGIDTLYSKFVPQLTNRTLQSKIVLTKNYSRLTKLYLGSEVQHIHDAVVARDSIALRVINDRYAAVFAETDIYFSNKIVSRAGVRMEHSSLSGRVTVSPRLSLAYKFDGSSQFSFAHGIFYQKPEHNFLLRNPHLNLTSAIHYIVNYQKLFAGKTLRVESFYKKYRDLVTLHDSHDNDIRNDGAGYAKGIELFWRDKTTLKNVDYWLSYSYLDTKRKYLDYPLPVQPPFAATHTVNLVAKRWVQALSTQFSTTYSFASGRPYYNPNMPSEAFMSERTMDYHSLGVQANFLRTFRTINAVFILNIANTIGNQQVFSYRYGKVQDANGKYRSEMITPLARRFVFLGAYFSIGADRRKAILD